MSKQKRVLDDPVFIGEIIESVGVTVLWQGEIEVKTIDRYERRDQKIILRRFCGIEPFNRFVGFGFLILDPIDYKVKKCVMDVVSPGNDIFLAFRSMQALQCLDKVSNFGGVSNFLWRGLKRDAPKKNKDWLKEIITEEKFQEIFKNSISDMERAASVLHARGIEIDPLKFQDEIEAGTIKYEEYMRVFNVESPEAINERCKKINKAAAPYLARVIEYLILPECVKGLDPVLCEEIKKIIYRSIARGARDEAVIVGVSVARARYESMLSEVLEANKLIYSPFSGEKEKAIENMVANEIAKITAEELLEKFPGTFTLERYTEIIGNFLKNWESVPEVDI